MKSILYRYLYSFTSTCFI